MARSFAVALFLTAIATPAVASAKQFVMSLQAKPWQKAWVSRGDEAIDTFGKNTAVRFFEASGLIKKRGQIVVFVANDGDTSFTFAPENVSASMEDGTPVLVIPYQQLAVEAEIGRAHV